MNPETTAVNQIDEAEFHCITCSDEALPVTVISVDGATGLAIVAVAGVREEVDITLVDGASPGDTLLVHGGVALSRLDGIEVE